MNNFNITGQNLLKLSKNSYMFRSTTIFRELQCPR